MPSILPKSYLKYSEHGGYDHCNFKDLTGRFGKEIAGVLNDRVNFPTDSELQRVLGLGSVKGHYSCISSTTLIKS